MECVARGAPDSTGACKDESKHSRLVLLIFFLRLATFINQMDTMRAFFTSAGDL